MKLFKLIWDAIGSEFGARHELYERNYGGNNEQVRLDVLRFAGAERRARGQRRSWWTSCMADYDLDGWTDDTWT